MPARVFLNGSFLNPSQATLSALDSATQHAVGLFETMLGGHSPSGTPWITDLDDHIDRLVGSASMLGLSDELRAGPLADACLLTLQNSELPRARIRLTITGGDLNLLARSQQPATAADQDQGRVQATPHAGPSILIVAQPATLYPQAMLEQGVSVTLADAKANPFNPIEGHKTLNYWWRLRELQIASRKAAAEALVFDVTNHLSGGCVSNVFLVKDNVVLTPFARGEEQFGPDGPPANDAGDGSPSSSSRESNTVAGIHQLAADLGPSASGQHAQAGTSKGIALPSPTLPGITRKRIIDWVKLSTSVHPSLAGTTVKRQMLNIHDVLASDEIFLTNSSWGVLPVVAVESRAIAQAKPGKITNALLELWQDWTK